MKKNIIILLLCVFVANSVSAQKKLKYKDVFDDMPNVSSEISYMRFDELRTASPEFANTYFQMGLINWKWLQNEDPFINYQHVAQLIYDTKLYLNVCVGYLSKDDKDVKKNKIYYSNYNIINDMSLLDQEDVVKFINKTIDNVSEYEEKVNNILDFYNKTVDKYNICVDIYKEIVTRQSNYKNLLLDNSSELKLKLNSLSQNFDSVTYYFDEFKTALANYQIKDYNQKLNLIPISTYRLDGLTHSNFLNSQINIWDYRSWVSQVLSTMNSDITDIRKQAIAYISDIRTNLDNLTEQHIFSNQIAEYKSNNILINKIEKYDFNSIMSACVKYETDIANLKLACMRSSNSTTDSNSLFEPYSNKISYYYDLYNHKDNALKSLAILKSRINDYSCSKLKDFLEQLYISPDNFKSLFVNTETENINNIENSYLNNMKTAIINNFYAPEQKVTWQKAEIPLAISNEKFADVKNGNYVTLFTNISQSGVRYATGFHKTNANSSSGFILKMQNNNEVEWVKNISITNNSQNYITQAVLCEDGGYIVTVLTIDASGNKTFVVKFDATGKQLLKIDCQCHLVPVSMVYDDVNEQIIIGFKGDKLNENLGTEDVVVETIDLQTKTSTINAKFSLDGNVAGIIKLFNETIAVCNYTSIKSDIDSINIISTNTDVAILTITDKLKVYPVNYDKPICAVYPAKIDAQTISIPAIINQNNKFDLSVSDEMIYTIFDTKANIKYCSEDR
ncbi:MAG: hypothetical protein MJ211_02375 [Bacteroidales bacterium]|nr:hypothetical protein [Bacteroidales bacterium]